MSLICGPLAYKVIKRKADYDRVKVALIKSIDLVKD
jgi:hypothetical protein